MVNNLTQFKFIISCCTRDKNCFLFFWNPMITSMPKNRITKKITIGLENNVSTIFGRPLCDVLEIENHQLCVDTEINLLPDRDTVISKHHLILCKNNTYYINKKNNIYNFFIVLLKGKE